MNTKFDIGEIVYLKMRVVALTAAKGGVTYGVSHPTKNMSEIEFTPERHVSAESLLSEDDMRREFAPVKRRKPRSRK